MSYFEHPDNRGVFLELWTVDLLDGDLFAALLLSQLLWWHQPGKDGRPRASYERLGHRWLLRPDDGWQDDCRMTTKQVRRVRSVLVGKGLVEHRRFKLNGAPTSAWRPIFDAIQEAIRPNPELPSEGQFHGSDPQGQVPTAPQGSVPIPSPPLQPTPLQETTNARPDFFAAFWKVYPRQTDKGGAKKAWPRAVKAAGGDEDRIVQAAYRYGLDPNLPELQFVPHASTWLNGERWEDAPLPPRKSTGPPPPGPSRLSPTDDALMRAQDTDPTFNPEDF